MYVEAKKKTVNTLIMASTMTIRKTLRFLSLFSDCQRNVSWSASCEPVTKLAITIVTTITRKIGLRSLCILSRLFFSDHMRTGYTCQYETFLNRSIEVSCLKVFRARQFDSIETWFTLMPYQQVDSQSVKGLLDDVNVNC